MTKIEGKKYLAAVILRFMSLHQLDQKEMAQRLEVTESTLSGWLNPEGHGISRKNAERIRFVCRDVIAIQNVEVRGNGNRVNSDNINSAVDAVAAVEEFRRAAMDAVMCAENLPSESKTIVYLLLKNLQGGLK